MQPAPQDLSIYQGDSFDFFFRVRERVYDPVMDEFVAGPYIDLTGWTGRSQIRATHNAPDVLAEFRVTITDQAVTPGGVLLQLTPAQTAALPTTAVWDVQLINLAGEVKTFYRGVVTSDREVTRA